jgi:TRAP-type C4-dicarboxylate transport system substrate-binding protein
MVNLRFWKSLPPDLQKIFLNVWDETVTKQRQIARREQAAAIKNMEAKGVEIVEPSDEELARWRKTIMPIQDGMSKGLKQDQKLVELAKKALGM